MGKNQRLRKEIRLQEEQSQKQAIVERKKERLTPVYKTARRVSVALIVTIFLLYGGSIVNNHLYEIVQKLKSEQASNK